MSLDFTVAGPQPNTLRCQKCGQSIVLNLPLPAHVAVSVLRTFSDLHQWCALYRVFKVEKSEDQTHES
jgi:hypothetical protein